MKDLSNQKVQHILTERLDYLRFPVFEEFGVIAIDAIKGRQNLSYVGSGEDDNFRALCAELDIDYEKLVRIDKQIHSNICCRVDDFRAKLTDCDCLITNTPGVSLVTREADCIPILIFDPVHHVIANVHSGWRGTVKHIVKNAVATMEREYESLPRDLIVALLPSIGMDHFVVRDDVRLPFLQEFENVPIKVINNGEYLLDAVSCVKEDLMKAGVLAQNVYDSDICATCEADQINSCRGGAGTMRNAALICIKD